MEGAVQALQMKLLTIHRESAALQRALGATTILRLLGSGTPKACCGGAVRLSAGFSKGDGLSSNARESQVPPAGPSSPLTPSRLQFFWVWNSRGDSAFLFPPSGSSLQLREPVKCRGEEIQTKKEKEGGERGGD